MLGVCINAATTVSVRGKSPASTITNWRALPYQMPLHDFFWQMLLFEDDQHIYFEIQVCKTWREEALLFS